jgi:hypothetical protein
VLVTASQPPPHAGESTMKPHIIEQIQRRLRHERPQPPPGAEAESPRSRRERLREWLGELSEDLANIDRSRKDGPKSGH